MASENLKIDNNNKPVSGAVTDDANQFIKMLRIDDTTKALKVMLVGGAGSVSSGTVAPISTPTSVGQMYVDTSAKKVYISTGTSSSADWVIMN